MEEQEQCRIAGCRNPAVWKTEDRTGTGTQVYYSCNQHKPQRGDNASNMAPCSQRHAVGGAGMCLRHIAGM